MQGLRDLLITKENTKLASKRLATATNPVERADLLAILMGQVLQMAEHDEEWANVEQEIRQIASIACDAAIAADEDDVCEAALEVLRYLPVRSAAEIGFVVKLAEDSRNEGVQNACAYALKRANAKDAGVRAALEAAQGSPVKAVREAAEM